ncbi:MAG: hypothetical protein Q7T36_01195 [Fluviicoccus sp.]|uniref:hypothetical protein n=1 Tax=Fluviicoccus sp. TaxID=2003552 RepID=UPI002723B932|nr:hypothetical protein [Fluviicoccus sp.]MDO8329069.1 hypothetical protein [Fluviicoccus sp.]
MTQLVTPAQTADLFNLAQYNNRFTTSVVNGKDSTKQAKTCHDTPKNHTYASATPMPESSWMHSQAWPPVQYPADA